MSYKNLDKGRLQFLLSRVVEPPELKKFIEKQRKLLIAAGAKLDSPPKNHSRAIQIISSMHERANHLIDSLLQPILEKHVNVYVPERIIDEFHKLETTEFTCSDEEMKELCKSTLWYLIQKNCPESLLEFLHTPIPTANSVAVSAPEASTDDGSVKEKITPQNLISIEKLITMALDDTIPDNNDESSENAKLIKIIIAIKSNRMTEARKLCERLSEEMPQKAIALKALTDVESTQKREPLTNCGVVCDNLTDELDVAGTDPENVSVFGVCRRIIQGKVGQKIHFIDPIGIVDGNGFHMLDENAYIELFPEEGKLIAYSDTSRFKLPLEGELGLWKAKMFETDRSIKYRLQHIVNDVYHVVGIPYRSDQYESVKTWIKSNHYGLNKPIFCLEDGILIKPHGNVTDFSNFDFENPFDAWTWLPGINLDNEFYIIKPLPPVETKYDCSDILSLLKKLLKLDLKMDNLPKLSGGQIKDLTSLLGSDQFKVSSKQIERIENELKQYANIKDGVSELVELILDMPNIRTALEEEKKKAVQILIDQQVELRNSIGLLKLERTKIDQQIRQKNNELKHLPSKVGKQILKTFEEAKENGEKTLAELALFECFIKNVKNSTDSGSNKLVQLRDRCNITLCDPSSISLDMAISRTGVSKTNARILSKYIPFILDSGFVPIFKGRMATFLAEEISRSLTKGRAIIMDIPVGLTLASTVNDLLTVNADIDTILIRNANLSPLESYAPELYSITTKRILNHVDKLNANILMTISTNPFAFAIPRDFIWNCAVIDVDGNIRAEVGEDYQIGEAANDFLESIGVTNLQWLSALTRMEDAINKMEGEDGSDLRAAIKATVLDAYTTLRNAEV